MNDAGGDRGVPSSGHRAYRPIAGAGVTWPIEFGTRYIVFVDVEEEFDWRAPLSRVPAAVTAMRAFPEAHRRFADHDVGLTCMIDYPIATDGAALDILRRVIEDGRSAIGTQLHAWVNPPFDEPLTSFASYAGNLSPELEAAKIATLTAAIAAAFGSAPIAFRSGRYGLGPRSWRLLREAGYRLDTSVRARYDYSSDGGPDFSALGNDAFYADGLIELPLTTVFTGAWKRFGAAWYPRLGRVPRSRGALARAGLMERVALTPEDMPIGAASNAVETALDAGERLLVFSFHSPSLVPGHTPYVRDAADLARFWGWWDRILALLERRGVRPTTLAELIATAR